jgi:hypothetical protein
MSASPSPADRWKWRALAVIPILLLSLGPQIQFWLDRGSQWHGAYATLNADEFLYSGYLNALIDGRPRRCDPFTGRDDQAKQPLPETAFSIQVVPAFVLSSIAKLFGITASTAFIMLAAVAGLLASLAVFWLLSSITGEHRLAAIGVLFVLITGTFFAGQGLIGVLLKLDSVALGLPFLRRYQPAATFFLFFVFCTFAWRALVANNLRRARFEALLAGLTLAIMVFSYLYLWTAAVAWLGCLGLLWLLLRPAGQRRQSIEVFAIVGAIFMAAIVPYAYLISNRSRSLDELQTLISTHRPDLFRLPEIFGAFMLVILILCVTRRRIPRSDPKIIFAGSFALLPLVVFNQQVFTGRSVQPFHFESFIVNYVVLIGAVVLAALLWQNLPRSTLLWIGSLSILLGVVEIQLPAAVFSRTDATKDEMIPALRRLDQLPTQNGNSQSLVFSPHLELMQILPTWTSHGTLLAIGAVDFGSSSHRERKESLYAHLYYSGVTSERLREIINGEDTHIQMSYYVKYVIFGHERVRPLFSLNFQPITQQEVDQELNAYAIFARSFSREQALKYLIAYSVNLTNQNFDFSYIDRWYVRDSGEQVGETTLYRLRLRD